MKVRAVRAPRQGLFVTFEGVEGSGKTTQIGLLVKRLRGAGVDVVSTREPGGTRVGVQLRAILLASRGVPPSPATELLLYAADRAQHLEEIVLPALRRGAVVLCDRYLDATLAYQGFGRRLGIDAVLDLHRRPPLDTRPHRTILLDLDPARSLARARRRNRDDARAGAEGRMERERLAFHRRVRAGYRSLARLEPDRFRVVGAGGTPDRVASAVRAALADLLPSEAEP
jgi:dTMP kinase